MFHFLDNSFNYLAFVFHCNYNFRGSGCFGNVKTSMKDFILVNFGRVYKSIGELEQLRSFSAWKIKGKFFADKFDIDFFLL